MALGESEMYGKWIIVLCEICSLATIATCGYYFAPIVPGYKIQNSIFFSMNIMDA